MHQVTRNIIMKHLILLIILICLSPLNAAELGRYQKITTLMMNNIDHGKRNCALNKIESNAMLNAIRAMTDQRYQKLEDLGNDKAIKTFIKSCNKTCGCDFFQVLVERFSNNYQTVFPTKRSKSLSCNKALLGVCKSAEFKNLKAELKDFLPSEGK